MNKAVIVLREKDLEDGEIDIIGVASTVENAEKLIPAYYGDDYKELSHRDIRENIEWEKRLEVTGLGTERYEVMLWADWFRIDEGFKEETGEDVIKKIIETDTIVELQFYPNSPIGFYKIYHYDVDKAIDKAIEILKKDERITNI